MSGKNVPVAAKANGSEPIFQATEVLSKEASAAIEASVTPQIKGKLYPVVEEKFN